MANYNPTPFPILTTERLTLRQLSIEDKHPIFALRSDTEINKYLNREPSKTIEDAIRFIQLVNATTANNNSIYWAINLTRTKTFVGTICLFDFSNKNNSCEIGYELLTQFQGQGIMQEALLTVIDFVFQTLKLKKIVAFTHTDNMNSTHLLSKCLFVKSLETDPENPNLSIYTLTKSH